jgi:hypothetical protein
LELRVKKGLKGEHFERDKSRNNFNINKSAVLQSLVEDSKFLREGNPQNFLQGSLETLEGVGVAA